MAPLVVLATVIVGLSAGIVLAFGLVRALDLVMKHSAAAGAAGRAEPRSGGDVTHSPG